MINRADRASTLINGEEMWEKSALHFFSSVVINERKIHGSAHYSKIMIQKKTRARSFCCKTTSLEASVSEMLEVEKWSSIKLLGGWGVKTLPLFCASHSLPSTKFLFVVATTKCALKVPTSFSYTPLQGVGGIYTNHNSLQPPISSF